MEIKHNAIIKLTDCKSSRLCCGHHIAGREGSDIPCDSYLMSVISLVMELGANEDEAIAG